MARRQAGNESAGAVGGRMQTETAESSTTPSRELGHARRRSTVLLAAVALALLLGTLATAIALSQRQSRSSVNNNLRLRAASSAQLLSTFLGQQAQRETRVASRFLGVIVAHTIAYRPHQVFLVDANGRLLAASPTTRELTLAQANPKLAHALAHSTFGSVAGASVATTFATEPVAGTPWRLVIAVPNSRLYTSIGGLTLVIPWFVFALVSVLGILLVALFARSLSDRARLAQLSLTLRRTARTDPLTGLYNRRALSEQLARLIAHARRRREPISALMIDLDLFKQTNDCFGHEAGDRVLCAVADCLREVLRADDLYGRWGGDEFLIALPASDQNAAYAVAERLRAVASRVDLRDIALPAGVPMSIGVASGVQTTSDELVRAADVALYENKTAGRGAESDGAGYRDAVQGARSQA